MRNILLELSYKGTNYKGFQRQKNTQETIENYLANAIKNVFCEDVKITASGRTDAGVHALKQCVNFQTSKNIQTQNIPRALNTYLPQDIRVKIAKEVDENFSARFSAKKKTYLYVVRQGKIASPILWDMVANYPYKLDEQKIDDCVKKFVGTHNFKAFASSDTDVKDFNRTIYNFTFQKKDNFLIFKITGNGFLYNMVRIIIGTILDIARGKLDIDIIDKMFETGDRSIGGKTAKPNGLYLYDVEYL